MSIKSKVLAAAATLTLVGGVGASAALTAGAAHAATPSCGHNCVDIFSRQFGTHDSPNFVLDTLRQGAKVGQPQILFRTSDSDPAEDYTYAYQGQVSDFYAAAMVSPAVNLHYGGGCELLVPVGHPPVQTCQAFYQDDPAFEIEYSPYGVDSGLCMGVGTTAAQGTKVALEPCGVSSKTVWIVDTADSPRTLNHDYVPLINGSDTNFSHPFVLTYPSNGYPTDTPRPQLETTNLTGFSNGFGPIVGTVPDTQLWGADFGDLR
jgi:hypothetical protein